MGRRDLKMKKAASFHDHRSNDKKKDVRDVCKNHRMEQAAGN